MAHTIALACRVNGLNSPSFRTPPRDCKRDRTVRRFTDGTALVSVRIYKRPAEIVLADMVEGVIVTNDFTPEQAEKVRASFKIATPLRSAAA